jgi:hypothetical protein
VCRLQEPPVHFPVQGHIGLLHSEHLFRLLWKPV